MKLSKALFVATLWLAPMFSMATHQKIMADEEVQQVPQLGSCRLARTGVDFDFGNQGPRPAMAHAGFGHEENFILRLMRQPSTRLYTIVSFLLVVGNLCAAIPSQAFDTCGEDKQPCYAMAFRVKTGLFLLAILGYRYVRDRNLANV